MIVLIILAALFLIMGIIILIGKGDNLIAGYNTASEEERSHTISSAFVAWLAACWSYWPR